jgi:hypothetical protein
MLLIILDEKPAKVLPVFRGWAPAVGNTRFEDSQSYFGIFG